MPSYWIRVHREAWSRVKATNGVAMLNLLVLGVSIFGAIWGLAIWGSADAARDELIGRTVIAAIAVLFMVLHYVYSIKRIPDEWDSENRARIETLEKSQTPQLNLIIGNVGILREKALPLDDGLLKTHLRASIKNLSSSQTIDDVEVVLANISNEKGHLLHSINKSLSFIENGKDQVTLNPLDQKYVTWATGRYFKHQDVHRIAFPGIGFEFKDTGPFIVKLRVSGRNQPAQNFKVKIYMKAGDAFAEPAI
jgi:hypothetical protein